MHHHVGVLILGASRSVTLGIGIGGNVKDIFIEDAADVTLDIVAKARIYV
jgi:hypothetical protein